SLMGITPAGAKLFRGKTKKEAVELLLRHQLLLDSKPLKDYDSIQSPKPDTNLALGKTWVYDENHDPVINEKRKISLKNWIVSIMYNENAHSLMPKMFLFWCEFFQVELKRIPFPAKVFRHFEIIRTHSLGNFVDLLTEVIADPGMIYYFKRVSPGKRKMFPYVADEVIDRFTCAADVRDTVSKEKARKLSRLLNKWHFICDNASIHYPNKSLEIYAEENSAFLEAYFDRAGAREVLAELRQLLSTIVTLHTAVNLTTRLYKFLLSKEVTEEALNKLIKPAAEAFMASKFDITVWLRKFLLNDFFYQDSFKAKLEKSPIEFLFRLSRHVNIVRTGNDSLENYAYWDWLRFTVNELGQQIPDDWGNADKNASSELGLSVEALHKRSTFIQRLFENGFTFKDKHIVVDASRILRDFQTPADPHELINEIVQRLYEGEGNPKQPNYLLEAFLLDPGQNPSSWTVLWEKAFVHRNVLARQQVEAKLKRLYKHLLTQPEYHYY
ncbi:MAG: DUF1800 family protein, partial [Chitinophagaceae bacterium]|nr:DUF1800 family protein [Chitinophagaceae bacterium]